MVRRLVMGVPVTSQEEANARWLLHPLLLHAEVGFGHGELGRQGKAIAVEDTARTVPPPPPRSETGGKLSGLETPPRGRGEGNGCAGASVSPYTFVQQLCCRPTSRESRALSTAMKRVVLEDRGGDQNTNEAVWAASVAAIHHVGVAGEAAEVVRAELAGRGHSAAGTSETKNATAGVPLNLSPALVRAWRSAQQARAQLDSESLPSDTRALLLRRAYFLLFLTPWVSTSRGKGSTIESHRGAGVARALRTTELVLKCLLSPAGTASTENSGGSDVVGVVKDDGAERNVGAREGDLDALLRIIQVQSERATTRTRGLSLAVRLLDGAGSDRATAEVLRAVTDGLQAGCPRSKPSSYEGKHAHQAFVNSDTDMLLLGEENGGGEPGAGRLHFMPGVECCDPQSKSALVESMAGFLRQCSAVLGQETGGDRGSAGNSLTRRSVLVHALHAVSMDYEWDDHDILQRSQLLPLIFRLVDDADRSVAAAASNAVQAVYRCAIPEHRVTDSSTSLEQAVPGGGNNAVGGGVAGGSGVGEDDTSPPKEGSWRLDSSQRSSSTPFQKAFFAAVRHKLQHVARATGKETQVVVDQGATTSTTPLLVDEADAIAADPPAVGIDNKGREASACASGGEEIVAGEKKAAPTAAAMAAAQVLALAHACCRVECGREELSTVDTIRALLRLVLLAESEARGWALRVCAATLPWVEPRLVDDEFR